MSISHTASRYYLSGHIEPLEWKIACDIEADLKAGTALYLYLKKTGSEAAW
jgi:hypothetical protein